MPSSVKSEVMVEVVVKVIAVAIKVGVQVLFLVCGVGWMGGGWIKLN